MVFPFGMKASTRWKVTDVNLKNWNAFELGWLIAFSAVAVGLSVVWGDSPLNFSVFLTGVLCVVLAAKGHLWTYVFGMYNTIGYAYVAHGNGLFGEMGLNLLFFLPMNVIGFLMWQRKMQGDTVIMRGMSSLALAGVVALCLAASLGLGRLLSLIEGQNTPYIDAATNVLSIAATFLMVWRFKEQWLLYIVLNVFTVAMWFIRTAHGSSDGPMMIVMWSAYLVNACYGWYNWNRGSRRVALETPLEAEAAA